MTSPSRFLHLAVLFAISLGGLAGCSSLPEHPVRDSDLARRAVSYHELGRKHYRQKRAYRKTRHGHRAMLALQLGMGL